MKVITPNPFFLSTTSTHLIIPILKGPNKKIKGANTPKCFLLQHSQSRSEHPPICLSQFLPISNSQIRVQSPSSLFTPSTVIHRRLPSSVRSSSVCQITPPCSRGRCCQHRSGAALVRRLLLFEIRRVTEQCRRPSLLLGVHRRIEVEVLNRRYSPSFPSQFLSQRRHACSTASAAHSLYFTPPLPSPVSLSICSQFQKELVAYILLSHSNLSSPNFTLIFFSKLSNSLNLSPTSTLISLSQTHDQHPQNNNSFSLTSPLLLLTTTTIFLLSQVSVFPIVFRFFGIE